MRVVTKGRQSCQTLKGILKQVSKKVRKENKMENLQELQNIYINNLNCTCADCTGDWKSEDICRYQELTEEELKLAQDTIMVIDYCLSCTSRSVIMADNPYETFKEVYPALYKKIKEQGFDYNLDEDLKDIQNHLVSYRERGCPANPSGFALPVSFFDRMILIFSTPQEKSAKEELFLNILEGTGRCQHSFGPDFIEELKGLIEFVLFIEDGDSKLIAKGMRYGVSYQAGNMCVTLVTYLLNNYPDRVEVETVEDPKQLEGELVIVKK